MNEVIKDYSRLPFEACNQIPKSFTHPMRPLTPLDLHSLMFRLSRSLNSASFCFASGWTAFLLRAFARVGLCLKHTSSLFPSLMWLGLQCHFHRAAMHTHNTICIFFIELWQTKEDNRRGFHRPFIYLFIYFHRPFMTVISLTLSMWRWAGGCIYLICDCSISISPLRDCRNHVHWCFPRPST